MNGGALDDLPQAGGDDVMLHLHALTVAEGVDAVKPALYAGEEHNVLSLLHQTLPGQRKAPLVRLGDHGVHIGQNAVDAVGAAEGIGLLPELARGHAQ